MRRTLVLTAVVAALVWGALVTHAASKKEVTDFHVIVNSSNPVEKLTLTQVSRLFLKKDTEWADGTPVEPVDMAPDVQLRKEFSKTFHNRSLSSVKSYWQQAIFSGTAVPPPELESEEKVMQFVASHPGAIGYLPSSTGVGGPIKAVEITEG